MGKSYGFVEITGVVAAIDALDIMQKAADVSLATWERKLGGRLVTMVIEGDVAAVTAAVDAAVFRVPAVFLAAAVFGAVFFGAGVFDVVFLISAIVSPPIFSSD